MWTERSRSRWGSISKLVGCGRGCRQISLGWTAQLKTRTVIALQGHDTVKLLQGLVTNHMPLIERGGNGFYTAFLNPQGRLLFDVFIYPKNNGLSFPNDPPTFFVETETARVEDLSRHIKKFLLRARCHIDQSVGDRWKVWQVWGQGLGMGTRLDDTPGNGHTQVPTGGLILREGRASDIGCIDKRCPTMGLRMVLPEGQVPKLKGFQLQETHQEDYDLHRLLNGVPENSQELVPSVSLPLESNFDFMEGVDFRKGCYIGQELTVRTYHTGVIRKRIMPMVLYDKSSPIPTELAVDKSFPQKSALGGADISKVASEGGPSRSRSAGRLHSGMYNIGLGLLRLESAQNAETGEIALALNETMRVRPFTPKWWPRPSEFSKSGAGPGQRRSYSTARPGQMDLRARYKQRNRSLLMYGAATIMLTLGMSYAAVPLYRAFCSATGYSGTPSTDLAKFTPDRLVPRFLRSDDAMLGGPERRLKITFNASTSDALPWSFVPQQKQVLVLPGESALAFYTAKNKSDRDIIGMATYNIIPDRAAPYFNKIQCFCFEEQKLLKGEEVDMPVLFFIDPDFVDDPLLQDVHTITLSYTFFAARYNEKGHLVPIT